ncbi:hypothetical protein SAMN05421740_102296 [Parapedobacter koreensis]|uniref:Uncharacterized protein n=2 Tax=Parapedobacter koreensis TaxID=332977 RepID=A0A1H7IMI0_9SPHI|nr:hypothetical protein SAMN05421740_102296 [Parapedobacter koreensis]
MLVHELNNHLDKIKSINPISVYYYNEILGDTSFLIVGLLESLLKESCSEWGEKKWIDDSLITNVIVQNNKLKIEGVIIWGKMDITEQWTDPFSFEIELLRDEISFKEFTFLFCDLDNPEITYEDFRDNRDYWVRTNRKWKYVINSNEVLI